MIRNTLPAFSLVLLMLSLTLSLNSGCKKKTTCYDESKVDPGRACSINCNLVCGCDGVQYCNACEAEKLGIVSYEDGPC